ncbi:nitroreductase family protein [Streptomyces sp. LP05-1]|uniref:Nitroreductase family protein n=1 Tax=Streptomyces pyxinae TaxID=2970734 RepID=A0ABT2CCA1_9ACTN|nr:nitroreductase family protein [Streptomyces sp. LP05-1]MCS0635047.1 nitroreductase family protein [Streptomyces sp. LP05-1]
MPSVQPGTATVTRLVEDACAAPSLLNAQPWAFRWNTATGELALRADPGRRLSRTDPDDRALHLGCGAALLNLRVAAARAGWRAVVRELPDPADPELLAAVAFDRGEAPDPGLAELYPAIARRRSVRTPFTEEPVPEELLDGLCGAALAEGARLSLLGAWQVADALALLDEAERAEAADPAARAEVARWTGPGAGPDGIPGYAFGPRPAAGPVPVRAYGKVHEGPGPGGGDEPPEAAEFERAPRLAVLSTRYDRPGDWLRAGQALERVLLRATRDGLATSLNSQSVERPELRWAVRDPLSAAGHPQLMLRFGYGSDASGAPPRRPVTEVLEVVPDGGGEPDGPADRGDPSGPGESGSGQAAAMAEDGARSTTR